MRAIETCRTAALGGHVDVCAECDYRRPSYNSCRDRHCPKCQSLAQAKWLRDRKQSILPTHYFHVVFTLPNELRALTRRNPRQIYSLLFSSSAQTLQTLAKDEEWLGAQLGITSVLHTWTRKLLYHPHIHCIVTGGGLDFTEQNWVPCKKNYLFPVAVMSQLFRGKFLAGFTRLYENGEIDVTGCQELAEPEGLKRLKKQLYQKNWVVYAKRPFGGAEQAYRYLGRYTHRVAISNNRLLQVTSESICFATKHGKNTTLSPEEFIRRFLLHVLPKRFVKIRHYGLLASANATTKLEVARNLLQDPDELAKQQPVPVRSNQSDDDWRQLYKELTGEDLSLCPRCKRGQLSRRSLEPSASAQVSKPPVLDSS